MFGVKELDYNNEAFNKSTVGIKVLEEKEKVTELVQALEYTLREIKDRPYLCANEIGFTDRAMCVKFDEEYVVFFNPTIVETDKMELVREIDHVTGNVFIVPRFNQITVCYQTCLGENKANYLNGDTAIIFQQAIGCLDGFHDSDIGLEVLPEFDEATPDEREEVIRAYLDAIKSGYDTLDRELRADDETKGSWVSYLFTKMKKDGKITSEPDLPTNRRERRFFNRLAKKLRGKKNEGSNNKKE